MEKFTNILETINQTREAIRTAEAKENKLIESYTSISNLKEKREAIKAVENDITKTNEEKQDLKITLKLLQHNAQIALFNETMPVALEVLSKYNGKPYGTKTRQKISDEVKEKTNCRFYISSRYSFDEFDIYPSEVGNEYNITCGIRNQKQILIDNKIQPVTFEKVQPYYINREYVTDIPQRVEAIKAAYKDAVTKQEELQSACDRFNSLAIGINHIYYDKHLYKNMEI